MFYTEGDFRDWSETYLSDRRAAISAMKDAKIKVKAGFGSRNNKTEMSEDTGSMIELVVISLCSQDECF